MARNFLSDFVGGVSRASDQLPGAARNRLGFQRQDEQMEFQREQAQLDEDFRQKKHEADEAWRDRSIAVEDWKNQYTLWKDKATRIRANLASAMTLSPTAPGTRDVVENLEMQLDIVKRQMEAWAAKYPQRDLVADEGTTATPPPGEIIDPSPPQTFLPDTTAPGSAAPALVAPGSADPGPDVPPFLVGASADPPPETEVGFHMAVFNQKQRDLQNTQYEKLMKEEEKLLREGKTTPLQSYDRMIRRWRENGESVPFPKRFLLPTDQKSHDGTRNLNKLELELSLMYRKKWPDKFQDRIEEVTDFILKGEINTDDAISAISRAAHDHGVKLSKDDVSELKESFLSSRYRINWTPAEQAKRSEALEVQMGIAETLERLQHKKVWTQMGAIKGRFSAIQRWMESAKANMVQAQDPEHVINAEIEGFLTSLGLNRDQIVRMRTGAAVNAAEDVLFKAIWGSELDAPEQIQAKLRAGYKAMQHARASVWRGALVSKFPNKTAEEIDELMEGIPINEGLDVEFNDDLQRELNTLEERFKIDTVNPPDPEDKKRHVEIIGILADRGFIDLGGVPDTDPTAVDTSKDGGIQ